MTSITKTKLELRAGLTAVGVCAAVLAMPAGAQEQRLTVEVGECVDLPTPEQRLACFEAQVEAARRERGSAEPAAPGRAAPTAEPATRTAEHAAPAPAPAPEPARRAEPAPAASAPVPAPRVVEARVRPEPAPAAAAQPAIEDDDHQSRRERARTERLARPEIVATVMGLRETVPNAYLITLDNGQVWRQTRPMPYRLQEGSEVRLYPSGWGDGYRLTHEDLRGYIQVERVR